MSRLRSRRALPRVLTPLVSNLSGTVLVAALAGCSGAPSRATATDTSSDTRTALRRIIPPDYITPSIVLPDLAADTPALGVERDGSRRVLWMQMRILEHPDGSIERAAGLLPMSRARILSAELPSRLGGGFVFVSSSEGSAQLWRAATWLAPFEPVLSTNMAVHEMLAGFDRLYLRHGRGWPLYAVDLDKSQYVDFGSLPLPMRIGAASFADPWRAVMVVDLRGPMATFDAGTSWFPIGISSPVSSIGVLGDRILLQSRESSYMLSSDGTLISLGQPTPTTTRKPSGDPTVGERPAGRRPLRLAIERGLPYGSGQAVAARGGSLITIDLVKGSMVNVSRSVYPDAYTDCVAVRLGSDVGFVCGEPQGATEVFAFEPPRTLVSVLRWSRPVAVFPSGNGALVARAPCRDVVPTDGLAHYCVRHGPGQEREIRFRGDLGAERVVALADGRIGALIAPRSGADAQLLIERDGKLTSRSLDFTQIKPASAIDVVRRGLWLAGPQEISPGVIGVWVEAGGPVVGLRIDADGHVTAGPLQKPGSGTSDAIVSGRFGLIWGHGGKGMETVDGGMTWTEFDAPSSSVSGGRETRSCSAVGCVIGGWLRVGWGPTRQSQDLEPVPRPALQYPPLRTNRNVGIVCEPTGRSSPPPASDQASGDPHTSVVVGRGGAYTVSPAARFSPPRWLPFGPLRAPVLAADQEGFSFGRDHSDPRTADYHYRAYVWGAKSSDWTRSGRWMIRFDDPYDAVGLPRSTAASPSPWIDMSAASVSTAQRMELFFDPGGRSGVMTWCPAPRQCKLLGFGVGETPVFFQATDGAANPYPASVVRTDENWFLLAPTANSESELWVLSPSGTARKLRAFPRTLAEYPQQEWITLVRRARTPGIAIWTTTPTGRDSAEWLVLPLDPATGQILDALRVGATDLGGTLPPPCGPDQDGWLLDVPLSSSSSLRIGSEAHGALNVRGRFRAEAGRLCVEALAARGRSLEKAPAHPKTAGVATAGKVPLSVWDQDKQRRFELMCTAAER